MANKMLIDASHPEETRVVVLRGNRVEEFDFESASKKQLRGNIYLAKVTRVEPSLQAAFVDYGGNRHGFLAFSEIHPDYYQIPVADRQALIESESATDQEEDDEEQKRERRSRRFRRGDRNGDRNGQRAEKRRNDDDVLSGVPRDLLAEDLTLDPASGQGFVSGEQERPETTEEYSPGPFAIETSDGEDFQTPAGIQTYSGPSAGSDNSEMAAEETNQSPIWQNEADTDQTGRSSDTALDETNGNASSQFMPQSQDRLSQEAPLHADNESATDSPYEPNDALHKTGLEDRAQASNEAFASADTNSFSSAPGDEAERSIPDDGLDPEDDGPEDEADQVEQLGGDAMEEVPVRAHHFRKQYKIQEVIKRRQILLVQVVKEERGNKGAALTTYLSLAGRYSVLMPNTARGGGISRKITDATDRQRLKSIAQELEVPEGMGVILRTAGAARTMAEVKRDFEYLLRMWETVREMTLQSTAPMLVYEEGSLIKRSIRDLFNKDIDEILVSGDNAYREARDFMRLLMPTHVKNVIPYLDPQPVFAKSGAEAQLDAMYGNQVTMKSGGSIVINQTEALVAIDVNSGRSTREHNIEDTALRTNLEACDEIARQLRLRDLAGLIVVDFIDMEESRNNRAVERRMKDALKNDRARIQVGHISHFGLLEMSRQRIRTGVLEGSTLVCPHCAGAGMVRSTASVALHVLRVLEDSIIKNPGYEFTVKTRTPVALYILNHKRANLRDLEERFGVPVIIATDDTLTGTTYHALERGELVADPREILSRVEPPRIAPELIEVSVPDEMEDELEPDADLQDDNLAEDSEASEGEAKGDGENGNKRRRRRRRRGGRGGDRESAGIAANAPQPSDEGLGVFTPSLNVSFQDRAEPHSFTSEPLPDGESASADGKAEQLSHWSYSPHESEEDKASLEPEAPHPGSNPDAGSLDEESLAPETAGGFPSAAAEELAPEEDSAKDASILADVPQRKRTRRSTRNVAVETPLPAASAMPEAAPEAEDEPQRRRPRRPARSRTPRRGADAENGADFSQVELGLMETLPSQPQPVNIALDREDAVQQMLSEPRPENMPHSARAGGNDLPGQNSAEKESGVSLQSESLTLETPAPAINTQQPEAPSDTKPAEPPQPKRSGWWQRAKASLRS